MCLVPHWLGIFPHMGLIFRAPHGLVSVLVLSHISQVLQEELASYSLCGRGALDCGLMAHGLIHIKNGDSYNVWCVRLDEIR